jgi:hypothetical protein
MLLIRKGRRQKGMCTLQPKLVSNRGKWKLHEASQTLCVWTLFVCTLQNDESAMGRRRVVRNIITATRIITATAAATNTTTIITTSGTTH